MSSGIPIYEEGDVVRWMGDTHTVTKVFWDDKNHIHRMHLSDINYFIEHPERGMPNDTDHRWDTLKKDNFLTAVHKAIKEGG